MRTEAEDVMGVRGNKHNMKSFIIHILNKILKWWSEQGRGVIGGTCSTHEADERYVRFKHKTRRNDVPPSR
jgi:hypothetical protein